MLSKEENELLTRVGPGTPAGAMLRRYWWPVAFSEAVKAKGTPVKVKLLAEEFALFRDGMIAVMAPLVTSFWIYARKQQHVASSVT